MDNVPTRTLDFRQAMQDFQVMFPMLDTGSIESVLRSNAGHVDATIDQLLQLSQTTRPNQQSRPARPRRPRRLSPENFDSTDSDDSIPIELIDHPPTSSDEEYREPPPMYTPRAEESFEFHSAPVEAPQDKKIPLDDNNMVYPRSTRKTKYKNWNPPLLGTLPDDFLRIFPQQFQETSTPNKDPSSLKHHEKVMNNNHKSLNDSVDSTTPKIRKDNRKSKATRTLVQPSTIPNNLFQNGDSIQHSYWPENNVSNSNTKNQLPRNRSAPSNTNMFLDSSLLANSSQKPRNPKRPNKSPNIASSSTSHLSREELSPSLETPAPLPRPPKPVKDHILNNGNKTNSDISPPIPPREPTVPILHNSSEPGHLLIKTAPHRDFNLNNQSHKSYSRSKSSRELRNHDNRSSISRSQSTVTTNTERRHSDFSSRRMVMVQPQSTSSRSNIQNSIRNSNGNSRNLHRRNTERRQRTTYEEDQYIEDRKLALMLQNEEFVKELQRNEDFLKALEKDNSRHRRHSDTSNNHLPVTNSDDVMPSNEPVVMPDPDAKYPAGAKPHTILRKDGISNVKRNDDEKVFKENVKYMGKSTRQKFNEIAKKFSVRRKGNYKAMMNNVDPVFADCDDFANDFNLSNDHR